MSLSMPRCSLACCGHEAIEMAKEYGSEEGWRMVNAVLDKLLFL